MPGSEGLGLTGQQCWGELIDFSNYLPLKRSRGVARVAAAPIWQRVRPGWGTGQGVLGAAQPLLWWWRCLVAELFGVWGGKGKGENKIASARGSCDAQGPAPGHPLMLRVSPVPGCPAVLGLSFKLWGIL